MTAQKLYLVQHFFLLKQHSSRCCISPPLRVRYRQRTVKNNWQSLCDSCATDQSSLDLLNRITPPQLDDLLDRMEVKDDPICWYREGGGFLIGHKSSERGISFYRDNRGIFVHSLFELHGHEYAFVVRFNESMGLIMTDLRGCGRNCTFLERHKRMRVDCSVIIKRTRLTIKMRGFGSRSCRT